MNFEYINIKCEQMASSDEEDCVDTDVDPLAFDPPWPMPKLEPKDEDPILEDDSLENREIDEKDGGGDEDGNRLNANVCIADNEVTPTERKSSFSTNDSNLKRRSDGAHECIKFSCNICRKDYSAMGSLKVHIASAHIGVQFSCDFCNKVYRQKQTLQNHIASSHKGVRFTCDVCNKEFSDKHNVRRHVANTHKGIKFTCVICNKKFSDESNMKRHVDSAHQSTQFT